MTNEEKVKKELEGKLFEISLSGIIKSIYRRRKIAKNSKLHNEHKEKVAKRAI